MWYDKKVGTRCHPTLKYSKGYTLFIKIATRTLETYDELYGRITLTITVSIVMTREYWYLLIFWRYYDMVIIEG